ncbi:hypothetical protein GCM10011409_43270 [Lentibacillus populi]|uniref:Uncharacterized protein n=1 Tax=Lentibacillus populi TaxID=1827502 RepID=A0A9W5U252_9BACI|nr:hypothetical protein [Lentibacillus populi]GGB61361.1 hypothetical protein GCM10011409_43270 [Lentibacillus populi]
MRAKIKVWGKEYLVESIGWSKASGRIAHISFRDELDDFYVFHKAYSNSDNAESMKGKTANTDLIYADLEKRIIWEES